MWNLYEYKGKMRSLKEINNLKLKEKSTPSPIAEEPIVVQTIEEEAAIEIEEEVVIETQEEDRGVLTDEHFKLFGYDVNPVIKLENLQMKINKKKEEIKRKESKS